jgi:hypothetical protein
VNDQQRTPEDVRDAAPTMSDFLQTKRTPRPRR